MRRRSAAAVALVYTAVAACRAGTPGRDSLTIAVPFEVATLDPHAEDKLSNAAILSNIYEPLVRTDAEMRIRPGLAATWESPDPLIWIFHLRPSVTFHGGTPLRAADVVYSYDRLLGSRNLEIRGYLLNVAEVRALGDLTVQLRTARPSRILLNKLSHVGIVPEGAASEALRSSANGTGPFALAGWEPGRSVRLRRNERYWDTRPGLRFVDFALARAPEEAMRGLRDGRYGLIRCDSRKVQAEIGAAGRFTVMRRDNIFVKHVGLDVSQEVTPFSDAKRNPFRNKLVREAIHLGIDRRKLVAGLSNYASPATQLVPRFVFGFDPAIPEPVSDPERARTLLQRAGLPKGFGVVLHARQILSEAAFLVRDSLGTIGIRAEVRVLPDGEFFALMGRHGATMWLNRFGCATGDASDILDAVVHSVGSERRYGMNNFGGYSNPTLDQAIEGSEGIEKPEERRNAVQQIMTATMDELVLVPLYNDQDVYAIDREYAWQPRSDSYIHAADITPR